MKTWNFGIIGSDLIADFHAKAIQSLPNARLIGICGQNQDKTIMLAQKYACHSFESTGDLLKQGEIDMVTIATPSGALINQSIHMVDMLQYMPLITISQIISTIYQSAKNYRMVHFMD